LESVGGPETTIVNGRLKVADTESVTVRVSRYVPTVKVSARRMRGNPTVEVSNVIPEIGGEREYRYVGVPFVTVRVSTLLVFIDFLIEVLPDTPRARLITANAVLESLMNKPAVSESVTVSRNKKLEPDVEVSGGTQAKKAFVAPVPCFITVHGPAAPAVEDSHLKVLVNCAVALSVATFTVNVSVIPTLRFAFTGFVYVGTDAVIHRTMTIPDPPFPPGLSGLVAELPPPPPPEPEFAIASVQAAVPPRDPAAPAVV
jgi:hypothetical protein